ncbi:phage holin, LLH family [Salicibibacter halophilus]|nr:phage holin, LLH family [Salicibibacter halophilus]
MDWTALITDMTLAEAILTVIGTALGVAVIFFLKNVAPHIKNFVNNAIEWDNTGLIEWIAEMVVGNLEEEFAGETGQRKFSEAVRRAVKLAGNYGIEISQDLAETTIQDSFNRTIKPYKKQDGQKNEESNESEEQ